MSVWELALALALVVAVVVAALLHVIVATAVKIEGLVEEVWLVGKRIAGNTVHIPELAHTNVELKTVLGAAPALVGSLERIRAHAESCPGCPGCLADGAL